MVSALMVSLSCQRVGSLLDGVLIQPPPPPPGSGFSLVLYRYTTLTSSCLLMYSRGVCFVCIQSSHRPSWGWCCSWPLMLGLVASTPLFVFQARGARDIIASQDRFIHKGVFVWYCFDGHVSSPSSTLLDTQLTLTYGTFTHFCVLLQNDRLRRLLLLAEA